MNSKTLFSLNQGFNLKKVLRSLGFSKREGYGVDVSGISAGGNPDSVPLKIVVWLMMRSCMLLISFICGLSPLKDDWIVSTA